MPTRTKFAIGAAAAVAVVVGGTALGVAAGTGDDEPLTGSVYERATMAALDYVGGGTVVETEMADGGAAYAVEIRLEDGSQVDVQLDESFRVIGSEADDDGAAGDEPGESDDDGAGGEEPGGADD